MLLVGLDCGCGATFGVVTENDGEGERRGARVTAAAVLLLARAAASLATASAGGVVSGAAGTAGVGSGGCTCSNEAETGSTGPLTELSSAWSWSGASESAASLSGELVEREAGGAAVTVAVELTDSRRDSTWLSPLLPLLPPVAGAGCARAGGKAA